MAMENYTKYEKARILGARALQLSMNAPILLNISKAQLEEIWYDPLKIAEIEFDAHILPITIKRPLPEKVEKEEEKKKFIHQCGKSQNKETYGCPVCDDKCEKCEVKKEAEVIIEKDSKELWRNSDNALFIILPLRRCSFSTERTRTHKEHRRLRAKIFSALGTFWGRILSSWFSLLFMWHTL